MVSYLVRESFTDRAQIVSSVLFLLEIYLIDKFLKNRNIASLLGIFAVSVVIANMHVAAWILMFVLVLPYLGEYIFSLFAINNVTTNTIKRNEKKLEKLKTTGASEEYIKEIEASIKEDKIFLENYKPREDSKITITKNDNSKYLWLVVLVILIGGIFTPTGSMPFTYFIKTYYGNAMTYINEHMPLIVAANIEFIAVAIITISVLAFTDAKIKLSDAFLIVGLYFMTIVSRRHITLLILLGSVPLIKMIDSYIKKHMNIELYDEKYLKSARKSNV